MDFALTNFLSEIAIFPIFHQIDVIFNNFSSEIAIFPNFSLNWFHFDKNVLAWPIYINYYVRNNFQIEERESAKFVLVFQWNEIEEG